VGGLGWWAQTQWVQRQRRLWREHDAKLAAVWRDDPICGGTDGTGGSDESETDTVIVLPDVIVLPEAGSSVAAGTS
jgi:hypothetical protein